MNIDSFKITLSNEELSGILVDNSGGLVESCVCKGDSIHICGKQLDGSSFWVDFGIRSESGRLLIEVVDAYAEGVPWGLQEYGVSLKIDKLAKNIFPYATSGGRTVTIVPFADVTKMLARVCRVREVSLAAPTISVTEKGVEISC